MRRAHTPIRPCDAPPRPRRSLGCSAHSGAEPLHVLTPLGLCTRQDFDPNSARQAVEDANEWGAERQRGRGVLAAGIDAMQNEEQAKRGPGAQLPPAGMAVLDGAAQSAVRSADARQVRDVMRKVVREATSRPGQVGQSPLVSPSLPSLPSTPTRVQPPAEAAPATTDPTTGRGTRRGRDEDVPPAVARDTSGLDGLPAPRDSKDASGNPYDNAASWVDDRVKKGKALQEQEQVTPSPYLPP